jgi:hypothetical protein
MTIKKDQKYIFCLFEILKFIGSDKPFAAIKFEMELEAGINALIINTDNRNILTMNGIGILFSKGTRLYTKLKPMLF